MLDALLEGFAAPATNPFEGQAFQAGDHVRVSVGNGAKAVTGRVVRPHGGPPATHAVVAPEGGGAHVLAPVGQVKLNTPAQHAAAQRRAQATQARRDAQQAHAQWMAAKPGGLAPAGKPVAEGVGLMLEAFTPPPPTAGETPAQSNAIARRQVAAAKQSLASGWNASKHPRAQGGRFGYTTGGKRATRAAPRKGRHAAHHAHHGHHASRKGAASSPRTLSTGAKGTLVNAIQRQLHVPVSGVYGPQTKAAVTRFQQQHGLQVDGVVGRQTLAALRGNPNARKIAPGPIASKQATIKTHPAARKTRPRKPPAPVHAFGGVIV